MHGHELANVTTTEATTTMTSDQPAPDGIATLLMFHKRIRAALHELATLSTSTSTAPPTEDWRGRAEALLAFLSGPLVWHDLDEEVCLAPLLLARQWDEDVEQMIAAMTSTHAGMEAQGQPLTALVGQVAAGERFDQGALGARVSTFIAFVEMSLAGEERLFQRVRGVLTADEKATLAGHIAGCDAARQPPSTARRTSAAHAPGNSIGG